MRRRRTAGWLLLLLMPWLAAARADTLLRYQFQKGQTLRYGLTLDMTLEGRWEDLQVSAALQGDGLMAVTVQNVFPDGTAQVRIRPEQLKLGFTLTHPLQMDLYFDSELDRAPRNAQEKAFVQGLSLFMDHGIVAVMDERGQFLSASILSPEGKLVQAEPSPLFPAKEKSTPQSLGKALTNLSLVLPAKAVAPGATWWRKFPLPTPLGELELNLHHRFEGVDDWGLATLVIEPHWMVVAGTDGVLGSMRVNHQNGDLQVLFDNDTGQVASADWHQRVRLSLEAAGGAGEGELTLDLTVEAQ